jgi:aryl-alcohol dehydrogenase-like predicted oxidoreductase
MIRALRDGMKGRRENFVLAGGAGHYWIGSQNLRKSVERRLRQLGTDYIDIFHFLGIYKEKQFPEAAQEELFKLKETGKVRFTGISSHDRPFIGRLARDGRIDVFMLRYSAAHRGAENEIFPFLQPENPGTVGYTATRWGQLLRRPKGYPVDGRVPTAAECYRFVLSEPRMHVVLTAPRNKAQMEENMRALEDGPLAPPDLEFMKSFGDIVHARQTKGIFGGFA